jgi:hypothetical protein
VYDPEVVYADAEMPENRYTQVKDSVPSYHNPTTTSYTTEELGTVLDICKTSSGPKCAVIINDTKQNRRYQYSQIVSQGDLVPMKGVDTYLVL